MKNFEALKKQLTKAEPREFGTTVESQLSECPAVNESWQANEALPPTPNKMLCDCMVNSLSCIPRAGLDEKQFANIFDFACRGNTELCAGINANSTSGVYGAYSMCEARAKLAFVMDAHYKKQNGMTAACDFDGAAETQRASIERQCESLLTEAKKVNEFAATATTAAPGATTTKDSKSTTILVSLAISLLAVAIAV